MLVKGARAVVAGKITRADVLIKEGKISRIASSLIQEDEETIDASGLFLLPGLIDVHVHLRDPGLTHKEDFHTGTSAALAGGVTSLLDMPNTKPPATSFSAWKEKLGIAKEKAVCDYALYFGGVNANQEEVKKAAPSFLKVYLGHSTGSMGAKQEEAKKHFTEFPKEKILSVHAEDEECMQKALDARQGARLSASLHHLLRPKECALKAVEKAARWTQELKRKTHLCHATSKEEVEAAGKGGLSIEVAPHHLFLSSRDVEKLGNYGKVNPPLREPHDVAGLWESLSKIDCIATDHAPHTRKEKDDEYENAPSGVPGLETTVSLFFEAARRGRISIEEFSAKASTNPARIFGFKNKGEIAVGKDADLILVDASEKWIVRGEELLTKCKWTPFEGRELCGRVKKTILRGELVFEDGEILAKRGSGRLL